MASRRRRIQLRIKIIAWSFIPTAIILLLVALTNYQAFQQVNEDLILRQQEELTRLSATELSTGFEEYVDRLTNLARLPDVYQGNPVQQQIALQNSRNKLIFFDTGVYLLDNQGNVIASLPQRADLWNRDWSGHTFFRQAVQSKNAVFSDIEPAGPNGEDVIALAVPVLTPQDELRGVAVGMFRLDASAVSPFYGTIIKLRLGGSGNAVILDGGDRIIYSANFSQIGLAYQDDAVAQQGLSGRAGSLRTRSSDGKDIVAGFSPVPRSAWTLIITENWNTLVGTNLGVRRFLWVLLALGLIIPTAVVMFGVQRITEPVAAFTAAAQRIAGGDFRHPIQVNTGDELEDLAHQFNIMTERLQESYDTLETRVAQRTQELTALNSIAAVVSRSLDLNQILPDALEKTIEIMGMDGGAILRLDEDEETLVLSVAQGLENDFISVIERIPLKSSVIQHVVETGKPVAEMISDYPPGPIRNALEQSRWKTVVSIPLLAQKKVLGAINVVSRSEIRPTPESLAVPAAIGQQIGVAMDNARLYLQTLEYAHQMETARAIAEKANASKSDFLANVSHELRTPLVSILGFARIVQKRLDERIFPLLAKEDKHLHVVSQVDENLEIILSEGQRLTAMINNLLDLEKIEAGKMQWISQPLDIGETIDQACSSTASLLENKPVELVKDVPAGLPKVNGDADKLLQVVINLISNAIKFTPRGAVTIRVRQAQNAIIVSVTDQGAGIAKHDQAILFNKFTQVNDPKDGKPKGTGLGLAISKEIVEHHDGQIWVESELGKGSTFSFSLPVMSEPAPNSPVKPGVET